MRLENGNIRDLAIVASLIHSDGELGIISLGKKLTHNYLSRLRSISEYLVIDWGSKGLRL